MNYNQARSLQALKRSHTELHQIIAMVEHSNKVSEKDRLDLARIIAQLANSLACLKSDNDA